MISANDNRPLEIRKHKGVIETPRLCFRRDFTFRVAESRRGAVLDINEPRVTRLDRGDSRDVWGQ